MKEKIREEIINNVLTYDCKNLLLEFATGTGKTLCSLKWINKYKPKKILIVVPRLVLINNWKNELIKHKMTALTKKITFVTYISLYKYENESFDAVIYDEAHHLTDRALQSVKSINSKHNILLSATLGNKIQNIFSTFADLQTYKITSRQAIDDGLLPDPLVYLIPLTLDNIEAKHIFIKNPTAKTDITVSFKERWNYKNEKNKRILISCTEVQYHYLLSNIIDYLKGKSHITRIKRLWLHKCGERLKWLSSIKVQYVKEILKILNNKRTLTFCNSISQTEELGKHAINSKNIDSDINIEAFNKGTINHITACDILNEGVNLTECEIGIFNAINSSEKLQIQKLGRILRHNQPIIIIPYFVNTREEEIVKSMLEMYNTEKIQSITINDLYKL